MPAQGLQLVSLTVTEIQQLLVNHEGRLCGRFYQRLDGTILTQDCTLGFRSAVRRISRFASAVLSAAMSINFAHAQTSPMNVSPLVQIEQKGEITLVVTDQSGAIVPKASVSLINEANHRKQDGLTDSMGRLRFSELHVGSYVPTIGWFGFGTERRVVSLSQGQTVNVEVTLKVAALMGDVVSVEADVVELEPTPAANENLIKRSHKTAKRVNLR